jgi:hypothetical protein
VTPAEAAPVGITAEAAENLVYLVLVTLAGVGGLLVLVWARQNISGKS